MFEAALRTFGVAACGGGSEVGQDVPGLTFERSTQRNELGQAAQHAPRGQSVSFGLHQSPRPNLVGIAVGVDDILVDTPGDLECDAASAGEQVEYPVLLA